MVQHSVEVRPLGSVVISLPMIKKTRVWFPILPWIFSSRKQGASVFHCPLFMFCLILSSEETLIHCWPEVREALQLCQCFYMWSIKMYKYRDIGISGIKEIQTTKNSLLNDIACQMARINFHSSEGRDERSFSQYIRTGVTCIIVVF